MLDLGACRAGDGKGKIGVKRGRARTSWEPPHERQPMRTSLFIASDLDGVDFLQKPGPFIIKINTHASPESRKS